MDWCGTSVFFWLGTIGFLIVAIENQQENRMVKQWVQPPINKNTLPRGGFFIRVPSHSCFIFIIKVFTGNIEGKLRIPCVDIFYIDLMRDLIKFEIVVFFVFLIEVFIGILGVSFEIPFVVIFYIDLKRDLIKFEIVFSRERLRRVLR